MLNYWCAEPAPDTDHLAVSPSKRLFAPVSVFNGTPSRRAKEGAGFGILDRAEGIGEREDASTR